MRLPGRLGLLLGVLVIALAAGLVLRWRQRVSPGNQGAAGLDPETARALVSRIEALEARERDMESTLWAPEVLAQQCGHVINEWWDALNTSTSRWTLLRDFPLSELHLPEWGPPEDVGNGIRRRHPRGSGQVLDVDAWRERLAAAARDGWELARVEFRHDAFATNATGAPERSTFRCIGWLEHAGRARRIVVSGDLHIRWGAAVDERFLVRGIDARDLTLLERGSGPGFREELQEVVRPPDRSFFIDPVLIRDLDGDRRPEILLAARNRLYRRGEDGRYTAETLCRESPGLLFTAVLGDFNGDAHADLLCARFEGLVLFAGNSAGRFERPGERAWSAEPRLRYGQVLTCGDVDGDGDLDVWLGQYKAPYERGQMPTPYHDANDGYPSYLLLNDGKGRFQDATDVAGLGTRRHRRTYSASWVDLDGRDGLDLLVVSDFAGADLYLNDGRGQFRDARSWFPDPLGFGMAHALGDFDRDGRLDLLMTGMHCPTASRLESLRLRRPGFEALDAMRARMTQGNRLYLGTGSGFVRTPLNDSLARSGWSWSCPSADFDNDGFLDVYIANGHETRQFVEDYEREFWLRDIYVADSRDDLALAAYFGGKFARTRGRGQSYGGYESNRLFLNRGGKEFIEAGWFLGVALERDARNAVAADLDGDGRQDLVVTTFEVWPEARQTVRVYRNELTGNGRWIGFRFRERSADGSDPFGAEVTVETARGRQTAVLTTGDSHRTQSPLAVHFGLGDVETVVRAEIRWPNGRRSVLPTPAVNHYHEIR